MGGTISMATCVPIRNAKLFTKRAGRWKVPLIHVVLAGL